MGAAAACARCGREFARSNGKLKHCSDECRLLHKVAHPDGTDGCWTWTGSTNTHGYGEFRVARRTRLAHRISYELFVGPIPTGLQIDHLCRNRACVNPDHLEPVTARINQLRSPISVGGVNARRTHCSSGRHELGPENTWPSFAASGMRTCRACIAERRAERVNCPDCGAELRRDSVTRHRNTVHAAGVAA